MSITVSVGVMIPANVVEVGDEISADQLSAIQNSYIPSVTNPVATQIWVQSQGYSTGGSGISQDQCHAIALTTNITSFYWSGSNWYGYIASETPYFSANKMSYFKFFANNSYEFTPSWSGTSFSLSYTDDTSSYSSTSSDSFTIKWNGTNSGIPVN